MNNIERIEKEIHYWKNEFVPSGNMGKWGRQVRLDSLNEALRLAEKAEQDNQSEDDLTDELLETIKWHDYSYMFSDDDRYWRSGTESEKRIKELVHSLIAVFKADGEKLLEDCLDSVPEQYVDGLTHKTIRGWFRNYLFNNENDK